MGMRDIKFAADEGLLAAAYERAAQDGTTLSAAFHAWLKDYAGPAIPIDREESKRRAERSLRTIREIQEELAAKGVKVRKYTREEMNER